MRAVTKRKTRLKASAALMVIVKSIADNTAQCGAQVTSLI